MFKTCFWPPILASAPRRGYVKGYGSSRKADSQVLCGWHHWLNGHEFEQAPGGGEGQGSLVCCSPWGRKELDSTEQLNSNIESL